MNLENGATGKWNLAYYIGLCFPANITSQLSIAFTVGMLLRKAFIALAIFTFYSVIVEPIAVNVLHYKYKY